MAQRQKESTNQSAHQSIYKKLSNGTEHGAYPRSNRRGKEKNQYRFSKIIKGHRFEVNFIRFFYGAYIIKQNSNLKWEDFVSTYWVGVENIPEVVAPFKEKFSYLSGLGLNPIFDPLLTSQGEGDIQIENEEVESSLEDSDEHFHEAYGYEGNIESVNGVNWFDALSQSSAGTPSASSMGSPASNGVYSVRRNNNF